MPTSGPGSSGSGSGGTGAGGCRGFTLVELLIVIAIVAISAGLMTLALRDATESRLEEEGARLAALLEMARAEARVSGVPVRWLPVSDSAEADFRFVGLSPLQPLPLRWLHAGTGAQVDGGVFVVLGPEAILPPQRIVLRLGARRLTLGSDGLAPFAVLAPASSPGS